MTSFANALYLDTIASEFPEAVFVAIVRHSLRSLATRQLPAITLNLLGDAITKSHQACL
jgi:hypothetical protein